MSGKSKVFTTICRRHTHYSLISFLFFCFLSYAFRSRLHKKNPNKPLISFSHGRNPRKASHIISLGSRRRWKIRRISPAPLLGIPTGFASCGYHFISRSRFRHHYSCLGMATRVTRGRNGDVGDQAPDRDPSRQPMDYESSEPKRRGKGKNITLIEKFEKGNCQPLSIQFDAKGGQFKCVGENAQDFVRLISNEIVKIAPFHYSAWTHVPDHFKKAIFPTLFEFFDLESWRNTDLWDGIRNGIYAECKRAYRERKSVFKAHFEEFGGCNDVERAKENCPEELDQERWEQLIDLLLVDPRYRARCAKNKTNRSKQRYASYHGSRSYAQRRHMEGTGAIEVFKKTHFKEKTGWINEIAKSDYVKMQEELTKSTQESGDRSLVDEIGCIQRALGPRRGHIKGVGRVVSHPTPDVSDSYPPPQRQWQTQMDERVEELQQQLQQQQEQFAQQQEREKARDSTIEAMNRQMEEMHRLLQQQNHRNA